MTRPTPFQLRAFSFLVTISYLIAVSAATTGCSADSAGCTSPTPLDTEVQSCSYEEIVAQRCRRGYCRVQFDKSTQLRFPYCRCYHGFMGSTCQTLTPPNFGARAVTTLSEGVIATVVVCSLLVVGVLVFVAYYLKTRYGTNSTATSSKTAAAVQKGALSTDACKSTPLPAYENPSCPDLEAAF